MPKYISVEQQRDKFVFDRDWFNDAGASHQAKEYPSFDGREANSVSYTGKKIVSTIKWADDKKTFTEHSLSSTADGQPWADISEAWSLSDDGKELLISRDVEQKNDGLKYNIKVYYSRQ